jgi:hypothetical protein
MISTLTYAKAYFAQYPKAPKSYAEAYRAQYPKAPKSYAERELRARLRLYAEILSVMAKRADSYDYERKKLALVSKWPWSDGGLRLWASTMCRVYGGAVEGMASNAEYYATANKLRLVWRTLTRWPSSGSSSFLGTYFTNVAHNVPATR